MNGSICLPIDLIQGHFKFLSSVKVKWNDSEVFQWVLGFQLNKTFSGRVMYRHFGHRGCKIWVLVCCIFIQKSHIGELAVISSSIFKILHFPPQTLYTVFYILMCHLDCADDAFCSTDDALFITYKFIVLLFSELQIINHQTMSDQTCPCLLKSYQWSDMMIRWIN